MMPLPDKNRLTDMLLALDTPARRARFRAPKVYPSTAYRYDLFWLARATAPDPQDFDEAFMRLPESQLRSIMTNAIPPIHGHR